MLETKTAINCRKSFEFFNLHKAILHLKIFWQQLCCSQSEVKMRWCLSTILHVQNKDKFECERSNFPNQRYEHSTAEVHRLFIKIFSSCPDLPGLKDLLDLLQNY